MNANRDPSELHAAARAKRITGSSNTVHGLILSRVPEREKESAEETEEENKASTVLPWKLQSFTSYLGALELQPWASKLAQ